MQKLSVGRRLASAALALASMVNLGPTPAQVTARAVTVNEQSKQLPAAATQMSRHMPAVLRFLMRYGAPNGASSTSGPPSQTGGIPWHGRAVARARRNGGAMRKRPGAR